MACGGVVGVVTLLSVTILQAHPTASGQDTEQQNAIHHLEEVKRSVDQVKNSWDKPAARLSHVSKRSAPSGADDLLLNSVDSYCQNFRSDPGIASYFQQKAVDEPLSSRDVSGYVKFLSDDADSYYSAMKRNSFDPDVFPVRVLAAREKGRLWLLFHVAHSDSVVVSRVDPFSPSTAVVLEMPEQACHTVVSKARFELEEPDCPQDTSSTQPGATFAMTARGGRGLYTITARVNLCSFGRKRGGYDEVKGKIVTQAFEIPTFQPLSHLDDVIMFDNDADLTVNLSVVISVHSKFYVHLVMWDWAAEKSLEYSAEIFLNGIVNAPKVKYLNDHNDLDSDQPLFKVALVNKTGGTRYPNVTVSIVINKALSNQSGQLTLTYDTVKPNSRWLPGNVIDGVKVARTVRIKLLAMEQTLPTDLVYFAPEHKFVCGEKGEENCTVQCQAFGADISSIHITRLDPNSSPIRSASHVLPNNAVAIMDMGVASPEKEGNFRCTVFDKLGKIRTQDLTLYMYTPTTISQLRLESKREDDYALITCRAVGGTDLALSLAVSEFGNNETRLDPDDKFDKNVTTIDGKNETSLTMKVPWTELRLPRNILHCYADGKRGSDFVVESLSNFEQNFKGLIPHISHRTGIEVALDINTTASGENEIKKSTFNISCTVTGQRPLKIQLGIYELSSTYPTAIERRYPAVRVSSQAKWDNTTVATFSNIPLSILEDYGGLSSFRVVCKARNKYSRTFERVSLYHLRDLLIRSSRPAEVLV